MSDTPFGDMFKTNIAQKKGNLETSLLCDKEQVVEIDPGECSNWEYSDRQNFELGNIKELAADIAENDQIQPILVRHSTGKNKYEVIAGERRWRACSILGKKVKAIILTVNDKEAFFAQHSENIKESLSNYSKSISYYKIAHSKKISQNSLAKKLGFKKSSFSEFLSYNHVPPELWEAVEDMSNVSVSTACYIRKTLNENPSILPKLISLAKEIRQGAGKSKLSEYLDGKLGNKKSVLVFYNKKQEELFTYKKNKIIFPDSVADSNDMQAICSHLRDFLDEK